MRDRVTRDTHLATHSNGLLEMEVLTDENISPAFKRIKYGIRGWLEDRTFEIKQELARVSIIYSERAFQRLIMVGSGLGVRLFKYPHFSSNYTVREWSYTLGHLLRL